MTGSKERASPSKMHHADCTKSALMYGLPCLEIPPRRRLPPVESSDGTRPNTSFFNGPQGDVQPAFWNHIYDAASGKLLSRWNDLNTLTQASGPGGTPKWRHSWNAALDVESKGADTFVLTTAALTTLDAKNTLNRSEEVIGTLAAIGDAPINDAHGFSEFTLQMLREFVHDSIDDSGIPIENRVHFGENLEQAFWGGDFIGYGDGASHFYPFSGGLDVVAHEIHHGFTSFHSGLVYRGESGGLNEGFSDIAGTTADFFYKGTATFEIGRDVVQAEGAARYMCDPTKDGKSIDHASNMLPRLDPHFSSGVPNKAFCRAAKRFSAAGTPTRDGVKRAITAFYLANAQYWTSTTTFVQGCQGTLDAARALHFSEEEVGYLKSSWADVGVTCD